MNVTDIPLELVAPNPDQPRRHFDEQALDELAASIRAHGLLQPIVVRPFGDGFQVIAGERRWRAHQRMQPKPERITARIIEDLSDEQTFVLATLENVNRRDLSQIEEAEAYAKLLGLGKSRAEVAQLFGKTEAHVGYRLDLLRLAEPIRELADKGQVSRDVAWYLSRLSTEGQFEVMRKITSGELETTEQITRYAGAVQLRESQPEMFMQTEADPFAEGRRRETRTRIEKWWTALEQYGRRFAEMGDLSDVELADALTGDAWRYAEQLRMLERQVGRTRAAFDRATAIVRAKTDEEAA